MKPSISRREFLKLAGLLPLVYAIPPYLAKADNSPVADKALAAVICRGLSGSE
ncbi:MAG: hypothetical protein KJ638_01740 [Chloroflexi bacterium]|nr:hypothetical protein [Chloroflexota bacterium]